MLNLAAVYNLQGWFEEAEELLRERAELSDLAYGAESHAALLAWANHAVLHQEHGQYEVAEDLLAEVVTTARRGLPAGDLGFFLLQYGLCLTKLGRFAEAETDLLEAHEALVVLVTERHRESRRAAQALVDLYVAWGKPDKVRIYRAKLAGWTKSPTDR